MMRVAGLLIAAVALQGLVPAWSDDSTALPGGTTAEIEFLLDRVSRSELTFVRNGDEHEGPEAEKHMRRKYEHFLKKGKIRDTDDFIDLAGTRSLMSGQPYTVRLGDGGELMTADWLRSVLDAYRAGTEVTQQ